MTVSRMQHLVPVVGTLARGVAEMLGPNCEVVVHDFSQLEHSIIAVENGHVTGRNVGDTLTDLGLEKLRAGAREGDVYHYKTRTEDGRWLRCTSIFVRGEAGHLIGAVCINYDTTVLATAAKVLADFSGQEGLGKTEETFGNEVTDILRVLVDGAVTSAGKPVALMQREDKIHVLRMMESKGAFLIKGAVQMVARELRLSRFTVYSYLESIRDGAEASDL